MAGDENIPLGQFKASCPQCGADLKVQYDGIDLKGEDRMICPVHGDVGSLDEARRVLFEKNRDNIIDRAKQVAIDRLKDAFKKR